ncbi:MAG TPA: ribokinase [Sinomonas sp.]|nr:ribokinase [Sinomonas sp.]
MPVQRKVVVVGSVNQDIVLSVPSIPSAGETLLATSSRLATGGKGANQAVAAARSGATTQFVGAFGADSAAIGLRETLEREGVQIIPFPYSTKPSGRAIVMVDDGGDNAIVVDQGANGDLAADFVDQQLRRMTPADVLIVQCELSQATIDAALAAGRRRGATVILNLAPYRRLSTEALACASVIVVNESEAAGLASAALPLSDPAAVARSIASAYSCACIVTLGERGSVTADGALVTEVPAAPVARVVDTTGAGDAFVGVLGAKLAEGLELVAAVGSATAAAAHTVRALGAQTFPTAGELAAAQQ